MFSPYQTILLKFRDWWCQWQKLNVSNESGKEAYIPNSWLAKYITLLRQHSPLAHFKYRIFSVSVRRYGFNDEEFQRKGKSGEKYGGLILGMFICYLYQGHNLFFSTQNQVL